KGTADANMPIAICQTRASDKTPRTFAVASLGNSSCLFNRKGNGVHNALFACGKSLLQDRTTTAIAGQFSTTGAFFGAFFYTVFVLDIPASYSQLATLLCQVGQYSK